MAFPTRTRSQHRAKGRWRRLLVWTILGLLLGFMVSYTLVLDRRVQDRFEDMVLAVPTRVYARPLPLVAGGAMTPAALRLELDFAGYSDDGHGQVPGTWSHDGDTWIISSRGYDDPDGGQAPGRIRVVLGAGHLLSISDVVTGQAIAQTHLDPARIATLYGSRQEDRRIVRLVDVPPLLVSGLQAVEDRGFKHNIGIDVLAIARAILVDLRAGHPVEGASTLTQQLVRNLFLSRRQTLRRKFNEALMSVLLDLHYSKGRILEAYINDVFLGQHGQQAVHGFAAAAEFYFGRRLQDLAPQDIALLVGLLKGPSYYDPRRYPRRARARRNLVLQIFVTTGLLTPAQARAAQAAPLALARKGQLPHNRFPAFMDLVRRQMIHDFDNKALRRDGLSVYTTLDPAAQLYTQQAISQTMANLGPRARGVQAAAVVTDTQTGSVLAVIGNRIPGEPGFNRALYARRPVGSIIKPFVFLVALTDPSRWNLASPLSDAPLELPQPGGRTWTPHNDDNQNHGIMPLVDVLAYSRNLASIRLGMAVGLSRIQAFLRSFGLDSVTTGPSLLIGAIDLAPVQVAQMYEYLAADGHALPLLALRGVLNRSGRTIKRYEVLAGKAGYQRAVRLVTWAMQQVTVYGTAHAIGSSNLAYLHVAGKTGTSNDMRDSWFAGFTADRLAVFWMGRDDNQPTTLFGSGGAMRAWRNLFSRLPTRPLSAKPGPGLQLAWINPADGRPVDPRCDGARQVPVVAGSLPDDVEGCFWQRVGRLFGGGSHKSGSPSSGTRR